MSSSNGKLLEFFLRLLKLSVDGANWIVFRDRFVFAADAASLLNHIDGKGSVPTELFPKTAGMTMSADQTTKWADYETEKKIWYQGEAVVKQGIAGAIPDSLFIKVGKLMTAKGMWDAVKAVRETRSQMVQVEMRRKLQDEHCDEAGDVRAHILTLQMMREEYSSMGGSLMDADFTAIILGSLPLSYDIYLSAIAGSASITSTTLTPDQLTKAITDEYDRRLSSNCLTKGKKDDRTVAFTAAGGPSKKGGKSKKGTCHNCRKKGHWKKEC